VSRAPTVGVIPVRSFRFGKKRLSGTIDPGRREELGRALADRVAALVEKAGLAPLIVTADPEVAAWAGSAGYPLVPDPGRGLDAACEQGVAWVESTGARWIVIHSDLPLLGTDDLAALIGPMDRGADVIAPSADGGTTAMSATGRVAFSYGPGSFHRHLRRLTDPVVVARTGLLHDLDSPNDLVSAARHPAGDWI
jgi:2-phospho-L-lactate/phosphoenolpyruvate guanylyltransferase